MYAKLFSSIVHSSIWLEDAETKVLWVTLMALMDRQGCVYGSVGGIARTAGLTPERTREILDRFMSPDPDSADLEREPEREGRRIEVVSGGWRLLNAEHYRSLRDAEARTIQNREAKQRQRDRESATVPDNADCHSGQRGQPQIRGRSDAEAEKKNMRAFSPPSVSEIQEFCREKGITVNAEDFIAYYGRQGWLLANGRKMANWKLAVHLWARQNKPTASAAKPPARNRTEFQLDAEEAQIRRNRLAEEAQKAANARFEEKLARALAEEEEVTP